MSRRFIILEAIDAIAEVIRAKKECEIVHQDFDHARILLSEAIQSKNEMIEFLMELRNLRGTKNLSEEAESRILKQVAILLRDQLQFSKGCESILDRIDI
ncbi:MAG: hypothetical protein V1792_09700 [Pseudomonadota bacterium]